MNWFRAIILFFVIQNAATAAVYQFQGTYYDYTGFNQCRRIPATVTLETSESGSTLVIDAPGAFCPPPQLTDGGLPMLTGLFSSYAIKFNSSVSCPYEKGGPTYFAYGLDKKGQMTDPIVYSKQVKWQQTLFEVEQHTVAGLCN